MQLSERQIGILKKKDHIPLGILNFKEKKKIDKLSDRMRKTSIKFLIYNTKRQLTNY